MLNYPGRPLEITRIFINEVGLGKGTGGSERFENATLLALKMEKRSQSRNIGNL